MATIERLAHQLDVLHELQSIVRTMKALSAVSIRQYEQAVQAVGDYYHTVELGLQVVLRDRQRAPKPTAQGQRPRVAIVFGSDHGLCGRVNEDLVGYTAEHLRSSEKSAQPCLVLAVGARLAARLEQAGLPAQVDFIAPGSAARITALVQQILLKVDEWRTERGVEQVQLFYNRHLSTTRYRPIMVEMLPVNLHHLQRLEESRWPSHVLPTYDLDSERLFVTLLRQYFFVMLFRACAESQASEHGSRLDAMRQAEKNLQDRTDEVGTAYRQARQAKITSELLDVVAGFEALSQQSVPVRPRASRFKMS